MAFDISQASTIVGEHSQEIALKAVMSAPTANLLIQSANSQSGLKPGTHAIMKMNQTANFQSGSGCGRTAVGNINLSTKNMEVVAIADYINVCPKTLYSTLFAKMLANGQNPETEFEAAFLNFIKNDRVEVIAAQIENLLWQGDKTLTGSNNLKFIDGLLKQIVAGGAGTYISLTDVSADLVTKLQKNWLAMPAEVKNKPDFRIFIGEDKYNEYLVAAANKNYFNPSSPFNLYGTTAILQPTPGLNGKPQVYARLSDLQYGFDGEGDTDKAEFMYSMETKNHYLDFNFALGVGTVNTDQIGITTA